MDGAPIRHRLTPGLLAVHVALALAVGCSGGGADRSAVRSEEPAPSVATTQPTLDPPVPYEPLPGEPAPDAKRAASAVVQALTTFEAQADPAPAVAAVLVRLGAPGDLVGQAGDLLIPGAASAGDIVYPQLAGLTAQSASVMVVVRQRLLEGIARRTVVRTVDVRVSRRSGSWTVTSIESAGGRPPPPSGALSKAAEAVLALDTVVLPDSARWDVLAGTIDDRVLAVLAQLGAEHRLEVTTLATGHPRNVFGTDRVSNHATGRAVDIWAVDGRPVVDQRDESGPLAALARRLLDAGVTELGAPWDLDGPGGASFTNAVHQDHLHIGFDR